MIVIKEGHDAKELVRTLVTEYIELQGNIFIKQWLRETYPVFCIIQYNKTHPTCITLLHKIDIDPYRIFQNPVLLDYIYTMTSCRRRGHANKLLNKIIKNNKIIGFCCNDESVELFVKSGFSYHSEKQDMVRYPPMISNEDSDEEPSGKSIVSNLLLKEAQQFMSMAKTPEEQAILNSLLNEFQRSSASNS